MDYTDLDTDTWDHGLSSCRNKQDSKTLGTHKIYDVNKNKFGCQDVYVSKRRNMSLHDILLGGSGDVCRTYRLNPDFYCRIPDMYPFLTAAIKGSYFRGFEEDNAFCIATRALDFSPVSFLVQLEPEFVTFSRLFPSYGRQRYADNKIVIEQWHEQLYFSQKGLSIEKLTISLCRLLPSLVGMLQEGRLLSPVFRFAESKTKAKNRSYLGLETNYMWKPVDKSVGWYRQSEFVDLSPPPSIFESTTPVRGCRGCCSFDDYEDLNPNFQMIKPHFSQTPENLFTSPVLKCKQLKYGNTYQH